jgi:hypothetical protein
MPHAPARVGPGELTLALERASMSSANIPIRVVSSTRSGEPPLVTTSTVDHSSPLPHGFEFCFDGAWGKTYRKWYPEVPVCADG